METIVEDDYQFTPDPEQGEILVVNVTTGTATMVQAEWLQTPPGGWLLTAFRRAVLNKMVDAWIEGFMAKQKQKS